LSASIRHARQSERIVISGRTDAVGNYEVNESIALARALSVRNYLRDQAPDLAAVITIDARGRCCFVAPNETEDGRSKNRRVEIAFFSQGGG
jgi:outer membrane protein OmpA-like peptidoglycan-associated protein